MECSAVLDIPDRVSGHVIHMRQLFLNDSTIQAESDLLDILSCELSGFSALNVDVVQVFGMCVISQVLRPVVRQASIDMQHFAAFRTRTVECRGYQRVDFLISFPAERYFQIMPGSC